MSRLWLDWVKYFVTNLAQRDLLDALPRDRDGFAAAFAESWNHDLTWLESVPDFRLAVLEDPPRCLVVGDDGGTVLGSFDLPPFWGSEFHPSGRR